MLVELFWFQWSWKDRCSHRVLTPRRACESDWRSDGYRTRHTLRSVKYYRNGQTTIIIQSSDTELNVFGTFGTSEELYPHFLESAASFHSVWEKSTTNPLIEALKASVSPRHNRAQNEVFDLHNFSLSEFVREDDMKLDEAPQAPYPVRPDTNHDKLETRRWARYTQERERTQASHNSLLSRSVNPMNTPYQLSVSKSGNNNIAIWSSKLQNLMVTVLIPGLWRRKKSCRWNLQYDLYGYHDKEYCLRFEEPYFFIKWMANTFLSRIGNVTKKLWSSWTSRLIDLFRCCNGSIKRYSVKHIDYRRRRTHRWNWYYHCTLDSLRSRSEIVRQQIKQC